MIFPIILILILKKIILAAHHQIKKSLKNKFFESESDQLVSNWRNSRSKRKNSNMKIFLYDFGLRGDSSNTFSIFRIDYRRLIEDQQMFYNFKCWLQNFNAVPLLHFVHAFEDFNRRFFAKSELRLRVTKKGFLP
jgi:hypothetical protein